MSETSEEFREIRKFGNEEVEVIYRKAGHPEDSGGLGKITIATV